MYEEMEFGAFPPEQSDGCVVGNVRAKAMWQVRRRHAHAWGE